MSFFNKVMGAVKSGREELSKQVGRFKNRTFLEGTIAVCARIAIASNGVSAEEKQKMIGFLRNSPELSVFNNEEVIAVFEKMVKSYDFDYEIGKGETMKYIMALKSKPEQAQLAVRVGIAIAKSDGDFDENEKSSVRDIITALGLQAQDFDL